MHLVALTLNWLQSYYDLLHSASVAFEEGISPGLGGGGDFVDARTLVKDCEQISLFEG